LLGEAVAGLHPVYLLLPAALQVLNSIISTDQHWEDLRLNLPEVVLVVVSGERSGSWRVGG
jgi:hypothetical protein